MNVDALDFGQEIVADLGKPWKFAKNSSVDEILIMDCLEHVADIEFFLSECNRVLKVGGRMGLQVPHFKCPSAYIITHRHYFSWSTFYHYPQAYDKTRTLWPETVELIVEPRLPPLNWLANLFPKYWEKFFYASGLRIAFVKLASEKTKGWR